MKPQVECLRCGVAPAAQPRSRSAEMQKRPAGVAALMQACTVFQFERSQLEASPFPVFLGYGDLTHEVESIKAGVLARLFADIQVRRFAGVHHFVPPEQIYTSDHVRSLLDLWRRAETSAP